MPNQKSSKIVSSNAVGLASEFFAGIGLMRLGLERAGWKVVFANDIDPGKQEMYGHCFSDASEHFVLSDIHKLSPEELPVSDLATASFPCTDLSLAGMRSGLGGKQSSAYWGFINVLKSLEQAKPRLVLLENVFGFLTSHGGKDFHAALRALNDLGYEVDAFVVDASHFVPQSRVRLFVVAQLPGNRKVTQLRETQDFYESDLRPKALAHFIYSNPDIAWNLAELPKLPDKRHHLKNIIEELPEDSALWWSRERVDYLCNQMSDRHAKVLSLLKAQDQWSYSTVFRRVRKGKSMAELRTDGIAGCLRTPKGGSGRQILVRAGYGSVDTRLLTPLECARLMGAEDFPIQVPMNQAYFGFGDAVCVPVVEWIAKNYLNKVMERDFGNSADVAYG